MANLAGNDDVPLVTVRADGSPLVFAEIERIERFSGFVTISVSLSSPFSKLGAEIGIAVDSASNSSLFRVTAIPSLLS